MLAYALDPLLVAVVASVPLDGHISYGQSWRVNDFPSFGGFGLNPLGPIPLLVSSLGGTLAGVPGPLGNGSGISLTGTIKGITNYRSSDTFSIGRCAPLAQQLLRLRDGLSVLPAILEMCTGYPGSTWHSGGGGGLAPGASLTGSISGLVLTVATLDRGFIAGGQMLVGVGIHPQTKVYQNLTLSEAADVSHLLDDNPEGLGVGQLTPGGVGTYQTGSTFASFSASFTGTSPAAVFTARASFGNMTVEAIESGSLAVGQVISGGVIAPGTVIQQQLDGVPGGLGSYLLGIPQTIGVEPILSNGVSWTNMLAILDQIKPGHGVFPTTGYSNLVFSSVGYTQGGSADNTRAGKEADLAEMMDQFNALGLNPVSLKFYYGLPAVISNGVIASDTNDGTQSFCRKNAPGVGGPYSGQAYASSPSYPWRFNGSDNIHTGNYGSSRWGEVEGYARWLVQDKNVGWTPLWRPLTGGAITRVGQTLMVPWARPAGPDFTAAPLAWQNNPDDGVKEWPQKGFHVRRLNVELTVLPTIVGLTVQLGITEVLNPGDQLEVSYAWRGPGGSNPSEEPGVGGNLVMNGPSSVLYPDGRNGTSKTIDAWAWPFIETIVV